VGLGQGARPPCAPVRAAAQRESQFDVVFLIGGVLCGPAHRCRPPAPGYDRWGDQVADCRLTRFQAPNYSGMPQAAHGNGRATRLGRATSISHASTSGRTPRDIRSDTRRSIPGRQRCAAPGCPRCRGQGDWTVGCYMIGRSLRVISLLGHSEGAASNRHETAGAELFYDS